MEKRTCKECGKEFKLNDEEIKFYKDRNLSLPKRCKECRKKNKMVEKRYRPQKRGGRSPIYVASLVIFIIIGVILSEFTPFNSNNSDVSSKKENTQSVEEIQNQNSYVFRNEQLREEHFEKHCSDFNYSTPEEYEAGASMVVNNSEALHKTEKEDGDYVYYIESTNEFVIISTDGYLRTYFKPNDGIDYFNRQ